MSDTKKDASVMLAGISSDIMSAFMADCLVLQCLAHRGARDCGDGDVCISLSVSVRLLQFVACVGLWELAAVVARCHDLSVCSC